MLLLCRVTTQGIEFAMIPLRCSVAAEGTVNARTVWLIDNFQPAAFLVPEPSQPLPRLQSVNVTSITWARQQETQARMVHSLCTGIVDKRLYNNSTSPSIGCT